MPTPRKFADEPTTILNCRVSLKMLDDIRNACIKGGMTVSDYVRSLIDSDLVRKHNEQVQG